MYSIKLTKVKKGVLFTAIAYVGVWLLVGAYWLCGQTTESPLWIVIATLCMMMPLIATVILQRIENEPLLRGLYIRWKPNRWWFVAWLLPALLTTATVGISCLLPGMHFTTESPLMTELLDKINAALPSGKTISPTIFLLAQVANGFIAGITINALFAFGEEIGWRGYLLKLFTGQRFLPTAIIIGAIWGLWHMPLILMGHNFPDHPVIGVFVMTIACICLAPIVQFIRLKSGSVVAAAIFHGSFNAFGTFIPLFFEHTDDLLSGPMGLAGIVTSIVGLGVLHLTDRRILSSTI